MHGRFSPFFLAALGLLAGASTAFAQQVPDLDFAPTIARPAYEEGQGPRVRVEVDPKNWALA